ncbi:uncharacterized protein LOC125595105 [Brassica napus]|uniref:uncharacterized protein LOC125595105 n=1 Tax=Brassica napus TaxID=3708 RepID=UPI002078D653|nr:uncharacterized protein LOC125595105 [Brassica napus]
MSKAYYRLEWDFIKLVLQRFGFHPKWINWIMQCVSTVTYSFFINGSPRGRVTPSRGIRQGDPLSPYIFIMCSEVLSGLCNKAQEDETLKGVRVARGCPRLNHLLFADDTMFFLRASKESGEALCRLLKRYEEASGQSINTEKSSINFSRHAPVALKRLSKTLSRSRRGRYRKISWASRAARKEKRDLFSSLVDRIKQKACGWSNRFLSTAGKMTMLTKNSISVNTLLVDTNMGDKKMAWIAWSKLVQPKESGVGGSSIVPTPYLASPVWEVLQLRKLLRMLRENGNLPWMEGDSNWSRYHHQLCRLGSRQWLQHQHLEKPWLSCSTQLRPMGPPPREFSQLTVSDLMLPDRNEWDIDMIQRVLPFEEQRILAIKPSLTGAPDKLSWLSTDTGDYSTKTRYKAVLSSRSVEDAWSIEDGSFDWKKSVWKLQTTPKIKLFIWKALHGALPVSEALKARGINTDGQCKRCICLNLLIICSFIAPMLDSLEISPCLPKH